jgi:uncharacterized membrane protein YfcA
MIDYFTYWYLFPVSIVIAILAISAGISGSNFWIPVYLIWLKIDPKTGFWLALLTMVFGFGSGIIKNVKQQTINWYIVKRYLSITIPAGILGTLLVPFAPARVLIIVFFAAFVFIFGLSTIYRCYNQHEKTLERHETIYWARAALAGFLKGLIATGLGKLILPGILGHKRIKSPAEAVGSTVVVIFVVNIVAVLFRLNPPFISVLALQATTIVHIMIWVAPGVVIGGQIGPAVARRLPPRYMKCYVGGLLIFVSLLMFIRAFALF